jgi:hypothetical protein
MPKAHAMERIIETYTRYAGENHDLATSLTARELDIDEFRVRTIIDSGTSGNSTGVRPQARNHIQRASGYRQTTLIGALRGKPVPSRSLSPAIAC